MLNIIKPPVDLAAINSILNAYDPGDYLTPFLNALIDQLIPPTGFQFIVGSDGSYLTGSDGSYLIVSLI